MTAFYDDKGAVGRRYRRQDEVGTPFCITIDGQTLEDGTGDDPRPRLARAKPCRQVTGHPMATGTDLSRLT
jgi:hypothetical protein